MNIYKVSDEYEVECDDLHFDAKTMILGRSKLAWAANSSTTPDVVLNVTRVIQRPLQAMVQPNDPRLL